MNQLLKLLFIFSMCPLVGKSQSKNDTFNYLKYRVEEFAINKESELLLEGCSMKYNYTRTLSGNAPWTQEQSFILKDIVEVFFVVYENKPIITLKFKSDAVMITDVEQDGKRNFNNYTNAIKIVFHKETISSNEGKKMADFFKKLAKECGAKFITL